MIHIQIQYPQELVAHGLRAVLADDPRYSIEPADGRAMASKRATVTIMSYSRAMSLMNCGELDAASRLIVITEAKREVEARQALMLGAKGVFWVGSPLEELLECVRVVAAGSRYVCRQSAQLIAFSYGKDDLTPREREVLSLVAAGLCNKRIATDLEISTGTVKTHVKSILAKLGTNSRTGAAMVAIERGLASPMSAVPRDEPAATRSRATDGLDSTPQLDRSFPHNLIPRGQRWKDFIQESKEHLHVGAPAAALGPQGGY